MRDVYAPASGAPLAVLYARRAGTARASGSAGADMNDDVPSQRTSPRAALATLAWGVLSFGAVYPWAYWPARDAGGGARRLGHLRDQRVARSGRVRSIALVLGAVAVAILVQLVALPHSWVRESRPASIAYFRQYEIGYQPATLHPLSIAPDDDGGAVPVSGLRAAPARPDARDPLRAVRLADGAVDGPRRSRWRCSASCRSRVPRQAAIRSSTGSGSRQEGGNSVRTVHQPQPLRRVDGDGAAGRARLRWGVRRGRGGRAEEAPARCAGRLTVEAIGRARCSSPSAC